MTEVYLYNPQNGNVLTFYSPEQDETISTHKARGWKLYDPTTGTIIEEAEPESEV